MCTLELVKKCVWWWVGGCVGWLCNPILVFYFGPNQAFGLVLRLGPSRTIENCLQCQQPPILDLSQLLNLSLVDDDLKISNLDLPQIYNSSIRPNPKLKISCIKDGLLRKIASKY